jgi:fructokinase
VTDKDRFSALPLPPLLAGYVFFDVVRTRLLKDLHGDSSGIRGAAWLW